MAGGSAKHEYVAFLSSCPIAAGRTVLRNAFLLASRDGSSSDSASTGRYRGRMPPGGKRYARTSTMVGPTRWLAGRENAPISAPPCDCRNDLRPALEFSDLTAEEAIVVNTATSVPSRRSHQKLRLLPEQDDAQG